MTDDRDSVPAVGTDDDDDDDQEDDDGEAEDESPAAEADEEPERIPATYAELRASATRPRGRTAAEIQDLAGPRDPPRLPSHSTHSTRSTPRRGRVAN